MPPRLQRAPNRFNGKSILHRKQQQRLQPLAPFFVLPPWPPWTAGPLSQATAGGRTMGCRRLVKDTGRAHCRPRNSEANNFHSWSLCFHLSRLNILCIFRLALFPPPVSILCRIRCPPANDSRFNRTLSGPTVPAVSAFQYTPIIICDQQQGVAWLTNRETALCLPSTPIRSLRCLGHEQDVNSVKQLPSLFLKVGIDD